jgi:hypothetical protein
MPVDPANLPEGRASDSSPSASGPSSDAPVKAPPTPAPTAAAAAEVFSSYGDVSKAYTAQAKAKGQLQVLIIAHLPGGKTRDLQAKLEVDSVGFSTGSRILHLVEHKTQYRGVLNYRCTGSPHHLSDRD